MEIRHGEWWSIEGESKNRRREERRKRRRGIGRRRKQRRRRRNRIRRRTRLHGGTGNEEKGKRVGDRKEEKENDYHMNAECCHRQRWYTEYISSLHLTTPSLTITLVSIKRHRRPLNSTTSRFSQHRYHPSLSRWFQFLSLAGVTNLSPSIITHYISLCCTILYSFTIRLFYRPPRMLLQYEDLSAPSLF